jgi:hypothetical protein
LHDGPGGSTSGSAYVFERSGDGWSQVGKLVAEDGTVGDWFGWSVAIDGDYAVVGAPFAPGESSLSQGAAYVFAWSGSAWTQVDKLTAADAAAWDEFGRAVAISGDYAIVGADHDDEAVGTDQGSAYVFRRSGDGWTQVGKLTAADAAESDNFGIAAAMDGDYAVVGAWRDDDAAGTDQGSAYIFERSGDSWNQVAKLVASDAAPDDRFGRAVALNGPYAVVGAFGADGPGGDNQGSAYVFERFGATWNQVATLVASDGSAGDRLGMSVTVHGEYAVAGASGKDSGSLTGSGAAYVFRRAIGSWVAVDSIVAEDAKSYDAFGASVALGASHLVVGASLDDESEFNQGSAYVYLR